MSKKKKLEIIEIDLLDWSASIGGEHYYAKLCYKDKEGEYQYIELNNILTQKMATYLNKKEKCDSDMCYHKGDESLRFDTPQDAVKVALKECKKLDLDPDIILRGSLGGGSVVQALWGKDEKKIKRINELYQEAEDIGWYSHNHFPDDEQDERMEAIDKEFAKILGKR